MEVIIALDFSSKEEIMEFVSKFDQPLFVKIGMEAVYANGFDFIKEIKSKGHKVFLDLKLHDIPNTVKQACKNINKYNIDMLTFHASGGSEMLKEGCSELDGVTTLAVTVLTSIDQEILNNELANPNNLEDTVISLATTAKNSNVNGVVCSVGEVKQIKSLLGNDFICVTPGISLENKNYDQKRVYTPQQAKEAGSDYIVVGRAITQSEDPVSTYNKIIKECCE